jgi:outer membrane protein assembly factor BamA
MTIAATALALATLVASPVSASAQQGPRGITPPSALPAFMASKQPLSADDLANKGEGFYTTPIPIPDSDPDTGFGLGGRAYLYWDGARTDPLFAYTPYRHRLYVQVFATTNGYQQHVVDYDAPYFLDSPFRLRAQAYYEKNTAQNYFGRGASTLGNLGFTAAGRQTFASFDDYTKALRQIVRETHRPRLISYTLYNKYSLEDPTVTSTVERDLLGGIVRIQAGLSGQYVRIVDYTGTVTQGDDPITQATGVSATEGTTRLAEDCRAARIMGCAGGAHDTLKLGIALDTRDFEPDPNSGVFVDLTAEVSSRYFASAYDYARVTFSPRGFFSPLPKLTDLVLAGRLAYTVQTEGVPFFAMNTLALTDGDRQGLGGLWTLRGFRQDRFVGPVSALANLEVRWTFLDFDVVGEHFALALAPFLDLGRVFDRVGDFTFGNWQRGEGAGLHVAWNKSTIIMFDYGVSSEDQGLYMDFGQQF